MSVLQRKELEDSPLADLHAIASELGIDGYRGMRREDLVATIVEVQGGEPAEEPEAGGEIADEPEAEQAEDAPEGDADGEGRSRRGRRSGRGRRGRRSSGDKGDDEARGDDDASGDDQGKRDEPRSKRDERPKGRQQRGERSDAEDGDDDADREIASGVLDVLPNGSAFIRRAESDVYVSQAQIRRCELRAGDEVAGPVRPPRRNERHPSLVQVHSVNGRDADPPEERPLFEDLTAVHATERLAAPATLGDLPIGKGSRVAISGPSGAGASRLLREVVGALAGADGDLSVAVVLAGVRPEERTEWRRDAGVPVSGGSFDEPEDDQAQSALLAVERAKRIAERGGNAVVAIDSLTALTPQSVRRVFGAGRKLEEGGSLTVVAVVEEGSEALRVATTRIALEPGGDGPTVAGERSGAQRADLIA